MQDVQDGAVALFPPSPGAVIKIFAANDGEAMTAARSLNNLIPSYKGMSVSIWTSGTLLATSSPREEGLSRLPMGVAQPNIPPLAIPLPRA